MKKIKLLVVDDERSAREEMASLLRQHADFEVIALAENGEAALKQLAENSIDAVFLDIDMPGMTGLELAGILSTWPNPPRVVFATAHNEYAVAAFDANAIDYILKPYREDRIAQALEKIREFIRSGLTNQAPLEGLEKSLFQRGLVKKMVVHKKGSKDRIVMDPADVDYFHAESAEVFARVSAQDYVVNLTLKELADRLDTSGFSACHKAFIVNLSKVEKITPLFNGNFEILLKNAAGKIPLSRRFAKAIRAKIGSW